MRWSENWCILWERYEADQYYYFYVKDGGGNGDNLMDFPQGISLSGPDGTPCYIRGDRVSLSSVAANYLSRGAPTFGPVPRTPANERAINYIISEMKTLGFEEAWHPKDQPWYTFYFICNYPRTPKPPDWEQRMERVDAV